MADTPVLPLREAPVYTLTARVLHWVTAAIVLTLIPVGLVMANFDLGKAGDLVYDLHKSMGFLLLLIVIVRLIYRLSHPPPPLPHDIPKAQRTAANAVHWMLYALLIAQALVGWIATSAYRAPIPFFWLFEIPPIWPVDQPFAERMFGLHLLIGLALAALICGHVGAALYHYFVRKDGVLQRMTGGSA